MNLIALVPVFAVLALLGIAIWVYRDAQAHVTAGAPVTLVVGAFRLDTPEAWAIGCVILFVVFVPLYLTARNRDLS